jgi:hypothetical protein
MKRLIYLVIIMQTVACSSGLQKIEIVPDEAQKKIDVLYDGKLFTSYIYPSDLEKPVLYPIYTAKGTVITRGFPRDPRPNERVDHPHHVGAWFNFGDVNGLDFWNNSYAISEERKPKFGSIRHREIVSIADSSFTVAAEWVDYTETALLKEETTFNFSGEGDWRVIERITKLTALLDTVTFTDNKEGLIAIRMDLAFETPSDKPETFLDANGIPTEVKVVNNEGRNGMYRNSEGWEKDSVWSKPTKWVKLSANKGSEDITIAIVDHKDNPGYPAHSHARGYGLFATNNMGSNVFEKGAPEFTLRLKKGESVTFKHLILVKTNGFITDEEMEQIFDNFNK